VIPRRGAQWEGAAAEYLKRQGAVILAKNYRRGPGEVDLIARMDGCVVFVEVKQRGSGTRGTPGEAVSRTKQARISGAALYYLKEHRLLEERVRFDVIEIDPDGLRHIKSAFSYLERSR
jgi:putative endonuclease